MRNLLLYFLLSYSIVVVGSNNQILLDSGNAAYARTDFATAIKNYEEIITSGEVAAELYYNLGNAYFRTNKIPKAILNYERAKKLKPEDEDIAFNLQIANLKTYDKIESLPALFLTEWKEGFINMLSETTWSVLVLINFLLVFVMITCYIIFKKTSLKQLSFLAAIIFFLLGAFTFWAARSSYKQAQNQGEGIIMTPTITAKGSPNEKGTDLFVLHEGTKVVIVQTEGDWCEVKLTNGSKGWILLNSFEVI